MSDIGEQTCPICAEEMDLTDQQLKPCDCGYEVCLWCWNHIMEMAEKDGREGRCPLCRTCYDKEKIMSVAAGCKAVSVTEANQKKKQKNPPSKGLEAKKHLTDVRVLQRNLAYIIGLPLNLAKEDLLKRRDYFGQYGKVLKVSVSRTSTGDIQHATNNSCCVYITYSSESEAARCIRSVHSFVIDGSSLRACFGTTKYCHAWLKNVPCSNEECMYLHDFGSQEDSFLKDELVSAFERSKDFQIIGVTNNLHPYPGKGLPPPVDENSKKVLSAAKPLISHPVNITKDEFKGSCADEDATRPTPARTSWVKQIPPILSLRTSAEVPSYQKAKTPNDNRPLSSQVTNTECSNDGVKSITCEDSCGVSFSSLDPLVLTKQSSKENVEVALSNIPAEDFVDSSLVGLNLRHCLSQENGVDPTLEYVDFTSDRNLKCLSSNLSRSSGYEKGISLATSDHSSALLKMESGKYLEGSENNKASLDIGESGIISNILMMNLDTPEGSLTELHNLLNFLGETDQECSLHRVPSLRKMPEKKQSRFSFAQQEDSSDNIWHPTKDYSLSDLNKDSSKHVESSNLLRSHSFSSYKTSEVLNSVPPGFSVPRRASPPGFSSQGRSRRVDSTFENSVNQLQQPFLTQNGYPGHTDFGNGIPKDGTARLSPYSSSQPDARIHMMRQQSPLIQQSLGFHDHFRNTNSYVNDGRLLSPQNSYQCQSSPSIFTQSTSQQATDAHVSNSHWGQWNGVKSTSDLGISEFLRNERLRYNKLFS